MSDLEVVVGPGVASLVDPAWDALAATNGSVFHTSRSLLPWWRDTAAHRPGSDLLGIKVMDGPDVIGTCAIERRDDTVAFAGGLNVIDYMGPVSTGGREKEVVEAITQFVFDDLLWERAQFAGLVSGDTMCRELVTAIRRRSSRVTLASYDQTPRIDQAHDGYLNSLNSKRRLELLRKRNRLTEAVGKVEVVSSTDSTWQDALDVLLTWKADASPQMREFVIEYSDFVRDLLASLVPVGAAHVVELRADRRSLAAAIVLSHRQSKFLYNMSYDVTLTRSSQAGLSPGVVLVSYLVEESLDSGWRFDFLKGAQDYKLRLGGNPIDMVAITVDR